MRHQTHEEASSELRSLRSVGVFQNVAPIKKPYITCKTSCVQDHGRAEQGRVCVCKGVQVRGKGVERGRGREGMYGLFTGSVFLHAVG